ncbi:DUF3019 domain-containing protein [Granulosicoccus sp.]|nr:DUF3019 domain-containing protein [Granulosicoccus sp.]MDB4223689.1 DUF3019 domain-containing protein [Granulosicoccus sp.]
MNIFRQKSNWLLWICVCLSITGYSMADGLENGFQIKVRPASCVALHKGQRCFQNIRFFLEIDDEREYCLYSDTHELKLFCANISGAEFVHAYASESSELFSLRLSATGLTVATITVNTAWVYRTGKRSSSGWRLF